ncbi:hypothetical protein LEP1GSC178_3587 [Leptospira licerasiae str. MMD4847]|uniref:Transposase n=3 Tax=Leptospira licerasiae TaxID=447106 RepID=A0ABP2RGN3_9LEPT|nr:hypothetical protein LEP1GSC178_3587 [Leptospira licerasiae str. MMD4847]
MLLPKRRGPKIPFKIELVAKSGKTISSISHKNSIDKSLI